MRRFKRVRFKLKRLMSWFNSYNQTSMSVRIFDQLDISNKLKFDETWVLNSPLHTDRVRYVDLKDRY
jgi:hypothetical protein